MASGSAGSWGWLEHWCGPACFAVAGIWFASAVLTSDDTLTEAMLGMELGDTPFLLVLLGIICTFICLLGLYPRLGDESPWLATGSLTISGFSALTQVLLLVVVAISLSYPQIWELGGSAAFGQIVGFIWAIGTIAYPVGPALFGIGLIRTDVRNGAVGPLLFGPLVAWGLIGATLIVTAPWFEILGTVGIPLFLAVDFLALGFVVRE